MRKKYSQKSTNFFPPLKKRNSNRDRVKELWNLHPYCYWCEKITVVQISDEPQKPETATFDHIYSKFHPLRKTELGEKVGVLSCYACNQKRGRDELITRLPEWRQRLIKTGLHKYVFIYKNYKLYKKYRNRKGHKDFYTFVKKQIKTILYKIRTQSWKN